MFQNLILCYNRPIEFSEVSYASERVVLWIKHLIYSQSSFGLICVTFVNKRRSGIGKNCTLSRLLRFAKVNVIFYN